MALTGLLLALVFALALANSYGKLFIGALLTAVASACLWPGAIEVAPLGRIEPEYARLIPINLGAIGICLVSSAWNNKFSHSASTLLTPCSLLLITSGAFALLRSGEFNLTITDAAAFVVVSTLFKLTGLSAAWGIAYRARSLAKKASRFLERYLLWIMNTSASIAIAGLGMGIAATFLAASGIGASFDQLQNASTAVAYAGGCGVLVATLYAAVSTLTERIRLRLALRKELPLLEAAWNETVADNPEILHPSSGKTIEQRAHRMLVEIRDASAGNRGDADHLHDELYNAVDRVEELLAKS